MTLWIIEPRDPLIVRDGRPFGPNPGARARPLDFPNPSTVVGGFRSLAGKDTNGFFDVNQRPIVKQIGIRGPLLVELDEDDKPGWLVPAPADALLLRENDDTPVYRHRLQPLSKGNALSNWAKGPIPAMNDLMPVGMVEPDPAKPYNKAPRYWYWPEFEKWLTTHPPNAPESLDKDKMKGLGHNGPGKEWRIHVAINADTLTGEDGALFATGGLEFWGRPLDDKGDYPPLTTVKRLGLATAVDNPTNLTIHAGVAPWGGERRVMHWYESNNPLPTIPNSLVEEITKTGCCRLILLTPACFAAGWRPDRLLQTQQGVTPKLEAAIVGKPQTVSGWNFEPPFGPKPTRRVAPAGSVYFLRLGNDKAAIEKWIQHIWLQNISDEPEDRLAGFGLAAVGVWDGIAK